MVMKNTRDEHRLAEARLYVADQVFTQIQCVDLRYLPCTYCSTQIHFECKFASVCLTECVDGNKIAFKHFESRNNFVITQLPYIS